MSDDSPWVVSPEVDIKQEWHVVRSNGQTSDQLVNISIGDSITRTVTTSAKNTSVMLLPDLLQANRVPKHIASSYLLEPKRTDSQNRGEYVATKIETVTYIASRAGQLTIPTLTVHQWNNEAKQSNEIVVQGNTWNVEHTLGSLISLYRMHIAIGLVCLVLCFYLASQLRKKYLNRDLPNALQYLIHTSNLNALGCETLLYKELLEKHHDYRMPHRAPSSKSKTVMLRTRYMPMGERPVISKVAWLRLWFNVLRGATKQSDKR